MRQPLWAGLGIVGAIALISATPGVIAANHSEIEFASSTLLSSLDSADEAVEENIRFSIWQPELALDRVVLSIPENRAGTGLSERYVVGLENHLSLPIRSSVADILRPELLPSSGELLRSQVLLAESSRDRALACAFIMPGDGVAILPGAFNLFWHEGKLRLSFNGELRLRGNSANVTQFFDDLRPDSYQLRFTYNRSQAEQPCNETNSENYQNTANVSVTGESSPIHLRLVEPLPSQPKAIEVDGVRFEVSVPDSMTNIPVNSDRNFIPRFYPGHPDSIQVEYSLKITNLTEEPIRFNGFGTLAPSLTTSDGQVLDRSSGTDALVAREPSDYPLLMPGESSIQTLRGSFYWGTDGIFFRSYSRPLVFRFAQYQPETREYLPLQPGKYQFRFIYNNTQDELLPISAPDWQGVSGALWTGTVYTPAVELTLGEP